MYIYIYLLRGHHPERKKGGRACKRRYRLVNVDSYSRYAQVELFDLKQPSRESTTLNLGATKFWVGLFHGVWYEYDTTVVITTGSLGEHPISRQPFDYMAAIRTLVNHQTSSTDTDPECN